MSMSVSAYNNPHLARSLAQERRAGFAPPGQRDQRIQRSWLRYYEEDEIKTETKQALPSL
jgi:hypothetical protein